MTDKTQTTPTRDEAVLDVLAQTERRENGLRANMDEVATLAHQMIAIVRRGALRPDPQTGWLEPASAPAPASGGVDAVAVLSTLNRMVTDYLAPGTYKARFPKENCPWHSDFPMPDKHHSEAGAHQVNLRRDQAFIRDVIHLQDNPLGIKPREPASLSPAPASGVDAVAGMTCDEQFELAKRLASDLGYMVVPDPIHADGEVHEPEFVTHMQPSLRALGFHAVPLSPAATPVSEAEPVGWIGDLTLQRLGNGQEGKIYPTDPCANASWSMPVYLAKPASSPAGGDVREAKLWDILDWIANMSTDQPVTNMANAGLKLFPNGRPAALSQSTSDGRIGG